MAVAVHIVVVSVLVLSASTKTVASVCDKVDVSNAQRIIFKGLYYRIDNTCDGRPIYQQWLAPAEYPPAFLSFLNCTDFTGWVGGYAPCQWNNSGLRGAGNLAFPHLVPSWEEYVIIHDRWSPNPRLQVTCHEVNVWLVVCVVAGILLFLLAAAGMLMSACAHCRAQRRARHARRHSLPSVASSDGVSSIDVPVEPIVFAHRNISIAEAMQSQSPPPVYHEYDDDDQPYHKTQGQWPEILRPPSPAPSYESNMTRQYLAHTSTCSTEEGSSQT